VQPELSALDRHGLAQGRGDAQRLAVTLFQGHERALRLDQLHQTLEGVAEQELRLRGGEQPAGQLDHERPQATLALESRPPAHHHGEIGGELQGRLEVGGGQVARSAGEARFDVPALGSRQSAVNVTPDAPAAPAATAPLSLTPW